MANLGSSDDLLFKSSPSSWCSRGVWIESVNCNIRQPRYYVTIGIGPHHLKALHEWNRGRNFNEWMTRRREMPKEHREPLASFLSSKEIRITTDDSSYSSRGHHLPSSHRMMIIFSSIHDIKNRGMKWNDMIPDPPICAEDEEKEKNTKDSLESEGRKVQGDHDRRQEKRRRIPLDWLTSPLIITILIFTSWSRLLPFSLPLLQSLKIRLSRTTKNWEHLAAPEYPHRKWTVAIMMGRGKSESSPFKFMLILKSTSSSSSSFSSSSWSSGAAAELWHQMFCPSFDPLIHSVSPHHSNISEMIINCCTHCVMMASLTTAVCKTMFFLFPHSPFPAAFRLSRSFLHQSTMMRSHNPMIQMKEESENCIWGHQSVNRVGSQTRNISSMYTQDIRGFMVTWSNIIIMTGVTPWRNEVLLRSLFWQPSMFSSPRTFRTQQQLLPNHQQKQPVAAVTVFEPFIKSSFSLSLPWILMLCYLILTIMKNKRWDDEWIRIIWIMIWWKILALTSNSSTHDVKCSVTRGAAKKVNQSIPPVSCHLPSSFSLSYSCSLTCLSHHRPSSPEHHYYSGKKLF